MSSILNQVLTLQLNSRWQAVAERSIREAVVFLCSESHGESPGFALDIEMDEESGELIFANPVEWQNWLLLPVRPNDLYIQTAHQKIRAPTVIVAKNYSAMPFRRPRLSSGGIWLRDAGVCQYSGQKLPRSQLNIDHVIPRDRGGRDEWGNLVLASKTLNSMKGNRLNHEVGLTLIRQPKAPPAIPAAATIREAKHPSWLPFLLK